MANDFEISTLKLTDPNWTGIAEFLVTVNGCSQCNLELVGCPDDESCPYHFENFVETIFADVTDPIQNPTPIIPPATTNYSFMSPEKGETGENGYSIPGPAGAAGRDAISIPGADGEPGQDAFPIVGPAGQSIVGPAGAAGQNGYSIMGDRGDDGENGWSIQGQQGNPGQNAQVIPGRDGCDGENAQVIPGQSIVGATGATGAAGQNAPIIPGQDADDAVDGWSIQGPPGQVGATGAVGAAGQNAPIVPGQDAEAGECIFMVGQLSSPTPTAPWPINKTLLAQTGQNTDIYTFTNGESNITLNCGLWLTVLTLGVAEIVSFQVTYQDENNATQTQEFLAQQILASSISATGAYVFIPMSIPIYPSASAVFQLIDSINTATYDIGLNVQQIS